MLIHKGWSTAIDMLREELREHHSEIHVKDFDFYSVEVFNQCENSNDVLLAIKNWESVHPLMKMIPVDWEYEIPFGLLYAEYPDWKVQKLLKAIKKLKEQNADL